MKYVFFCKEKFKMGLLKLKNISKIFIITKDSNFIINPKFTIEDQKNYVEKLENLKMLFLKSHIIKK